MTKQSELTRSNLPSLPESTLFLPRNEGEKNLPQAWKSAYKLKFYPDDFKITCSSYWSEQFPRRSSNQTKTTIVTSTNIANAAFLIAIPYSVQQPPLRPVLSRVSCFLFGVRRSNWQPQDMNHDSYFFRFPTLLNWLHLNQNAAGFTQFSFMPSAFFYLSGSLQVGEQCTPETTNRRKR